MTRPVPGILFPLAALTLLLAVAGPVAAVLLAVSPLEVAHAFAAPAAAAAVRVSLLASLTSTAMATLLGVPAGHWIARTHPRLRAPLLFALALPLAFSPVALGIVLLSVLRGTSNPDSLAGVCAAEFFVSGSFVAIASSAAFAALDPIYEDAARTLALTYGFVVLAALVLLAQWVLRRRVVV